MAQALGVSRGLAKRLIAEGYVTLNGKPFSKGKDLQAGDKLVVKDFSIRSSDGPIKKIWESDDLLALHKPAGLPTTSVLGSNDSLEQRIAHHFPRMKDIGGECGLINRLDNQTSGIVLAAKSDVSYKTHRELFKTHKVTKWYLAICPPTDYHDMQVSLPIVQRGKKVGSAAGGLPATTTITTLACSRLASVVLCKTNFGRRHQIRYHLAQSKTPLLGDPLYDHGQDEGSVFFLHAAAVRFRSKTLVDALPKEWQDKLRLLELREFCMDQQVEYS